VAVAVFGTQARYAYHRYEAPSDFNAIRDGSDQLAFLSFDEMSEQKLTDKVLPGPAVFVESHDVLVASDSPIQKLADLSGQSACFTVSKAYDGDIQMIDSSSIRVHQHAANTKKKTPDPVAWVAR
jgi:hypothetical protein